MSYLADPPVTPIDIDAGVEYRYVVAQQGHISMSVDGDNADLEIFFTFGSPAVMRITFTGTVLATPQYRTVTCRLTLPGGSVLLHQPVFRILGTSATQRMPSITCLNSRSVSPGQGAGVVITADIAVTSFNALNLPAGMTVNTETGGVYGPAPTVNGFYVITLQAINGAYTSSRYYVIIVGTGVVGGGGGGGTTGQSSRVYYDGDFTIAQLAGPPKFWIPFATDPKPYGYKVKYWQFLDNFVEPPLGELGPLNPGGVDYGYVGGSPGTFETVGGGVIEFEREYARVPDGRSEFESYVVEYYLRFFVLGFPSLCKEPIPVTTPTRIQFDYFQVPSEAFPDVAAIDLQRKPMLLDTCIGIAFANGAIEFLTIENDEEFLCEDATLKLWKPGIYERVQRFARWRDFQHVLQDE